MTLHECFDLALGFLHDSQVLGVWSLWIIGLGWDDTPGVLSGGYRYSCSLAPVRLLCEY